MARRLTLEGVKVLACIEIMPYSTGLRRNIVQCLQDYDIPLLLSHKVKSIHGRYRAEGVTIAQLNENFNELENTSKFIECATVLLSVGLIPENELSKKAGVLMDSSTNGAIVDNTFCTSVEGIFACGNVLHVHDLVDNVTIEAEIAGRNAALYCKRADLFKNGQFVNVVASTGVRYIIPQRINKNFIEPFTLRFRVDNVYHNKKIVVQNAKKDIAIFKKEYLSPGEMESILISEKLIAKMNFSEDIIVKLEDV